MKPVQLKFKTMLFLLVVGCTLSSCNKKGVLVESRFLKDAEGWKIIGDAQGGNGEQVESSYSPDDGVQNGHIHAKDNATGGTWYFSAPKDYLGNHNDFYEASLSFNLSQKSAMNSQFKNNDIIFKNGEKKISYQFKSYPGEDWTAYSVPIHEDSGWMKGNFDSEKPATKADIKAVLSNMTEFWIRGEYESGGDEGSLDEVEISKK